MAKQQYLPRTTVSAFEFLSRFPNEEIARKHIEQIRWKGQIICPYCGKHEISLRREAGYYRCRKCRQIFTVRVGTIFHRSHIPLHKWLYAIYLVMTSRKGVSSMWMAWRTPMVLRASGPCLNVDSTEFFTGSAVNILSDM